MDPERYIKLGSVFVVVLALTIAVVSAGPATQSPDRAEPADVETVDVDSFQPDQILSEYHDDTGQISMSANAEGNLVLIDLAHQNQITEDQLGPVIRTLTTNGAQVDFLTSEETRGTEFNESLREADAFVSISPQETYSENEMDGLSAFENGGGRIVLMQEPKQASVGLVSTLIIPPRSASQPAPMAPLASEFGLSFGNGYLYNMQENDNNYRTVFASPSGSDSVTEGISQISIREGTTVHGGTPVLVASEDSTLSTTRESSQYPIAASSGNVTAIGDTTFFTETGYQEYDNEVLTGNMLDFLVGGDKVEGVPKKPQPEGPPTGPINGSDETTERTGSEQPPQPTE